MQNVVSSKSTTIIYSTKVSWQCQLQVNGCKMMLHQVCTYQRFLSNSHILDPICSNAQPLFVCSLSPCASLIAEHSAILCSYATSNIRFVHGFKQITLVTLPSSNRWTKQLSWSSHLLLCGELWDVMLMSGTVPL